MIYNLLQISDVDSEGRVQPCWRPIPKAVDELSSVLSGVSPLFYDPAIYNCLNVGLDLGGFQASIGSSYASGNEYLVYDKPTACESINSDTAEEGDRKFFDGLFERLVTGDIDLNAIMVSAVHDVKYKGINAYYLAKVW